MKKASLLICVVFFACIVCSCASYLEGIVWDESIPPEQSAKICFWNYWPTSYNGINLNVKRNKFYIAVFPAGEAEFSGDVFWSDNGYYVRTTFQAKDAGFSCNFEAGEDYWAVVEYEYNRDTKRRIWGISLYKEKIRIKVGLPDPKNRVGGFIPFDPPIVSN